MRTIKFRGKAIEPSLGWIYGDLVQISNSYPDIHRYKDTIEVNGEKCKRYELDKVNPDTVGQFTSLFDRNKMEIYEGDILALAGVETERLEVRFVRGVFAFLWNGNLDDECPLNAPTHCCVEVIGNIHDNPELLKGGKG